MNARIASIVVGFFLVFPVARSQTPIWTLNPSKDAFYSGGKVGIGTSTPAGNLHVFQPSTSVTSVIETAGATNAWAKLRFKNANGEWDVGTSRSFNGDAFYVDRLGTAAIEFQLSPAGDLGLGVTPLARLHLFDPASVSQRIETGGGTNAWSRIEFVNGNGQWVAGTSRSFHGDAFYVDRLGTAAIEFQLSPAGDLGLGVTPLARLHLFDPASVSQRIETGGGTNAWSRIEFVNGNGQWNVGSSRNFNDDQFYFARQGSAEMAFTIQPNGDAFVNRNLSTRTLTIRGGADVAEPFFMDEPDLEKGTVVVIDDEHAGRLKSSTSAYDTRVAGVISGANGINPGLSLQQEGAIEGGQDVAVSGRVYVRADASTAPIKPGDLLTTSGLRGHAMKATDHGRAMGAVIGKALTPLERGTGLVLILVALQ